MESKKKEGINPENRMTRREFIKGTAAAGVTVIAASGVLSACATGDAATDKSASRKVKVSQTFDCDIVVAGCGISGITCIAAAALNGAKVIGLEKQAKTGGNGQFTEGAFAVDSPLQQKMDIRIKKSNLMKSVLGSSQWVADGALWDKFVDMSGKNIQWLMDKGVAFDNPIDGDGIAAFPCIHLFAGEGARSAGVTLLPKLSQIALDNGAKFMTETAFKSLITNDAGKVIGCYATNAAGETLQFNSKVVILATGSFAGDEELMNLRGFNVAENDIQHNPLTMYNTGDGIKAAKNQCNAKTMVEQAAWNSFNKIGKLDRWNMFSVWAVTKPSECMFINQDGARFIAEDYADKNEEFAAVPGLTQKTIYSVFDRASIKRWVGYPVFQHPPLYKGFDLDFVDHINDPALSVGDTLEETAKKAGVDPSLLQTAITRYNKLVAEGEDADFGKVSDKLFPISTPPYYIAKITIDPYVMLGGLYTDSYMRVLDARKNVIDGLYAIGTDGCMLFRTYYAYDYACTSANAHNIFSARVAADHACQNL
jgi:fumarate reductase flavoprotein subunit